MLRRRMLVPAFGAVMLVALAACQSESADTADTSATMDTAATAAAPAPMAMADGAMLDPNAATRAEIVAVPGMTEPAADALIARRPYSTMLAADSVLSAHLDSAQRQQVYARVWHPIDLNTASGAEILLIPGVGPRMQHEFEEYRPYRGIEQFRREIGKYVDSAEVARLERYVAIR
jgi:DNA uptake protein ComE-like DNA-binding protein